MQPNRRYDPPAAGVTQICVETMMHLTCTNMPIEKLESALKEVRQ